MTIPELGTIRAAHPPVDRADQQPHARPARRGRVSAAACTSGSTIPPSKRELDIVRRRVQAASARARPRNVVAAIAVNARRGTSRSPPGSRRRSTGCAALQMLGVDRGWTPRPSTARSAVLKYGEDQDVSARPAWSLVRPRDRRPRPAAARERVRPLASTTPGVPVTPERGARFAEALTLDVSRFRARGCTGWPADLCPTRRRPGVRPVLRGGLRRPALGLGARPRDGGSVSTRPRTTGRSARTWAGGGVPRAPRRRR